VSQTDIPGYTYGTDAVPRSPLSLDELGLLKATLLMGDDDLAALRRSGQVLAGRVEEILDVWYGFVGANPHLLAAFTGPDGQPDQAYLAAVRRRFGRWILDTARAEYDQAWLDYQQEIGLRHHRGGKNRTDGARAADHIPPALRPGPAGAHHDHPEAVPGRGRGRPGRGRGHASGLGQGGPAPGDPLEPTVRPRRRLLTRPGPPPGAS